VKPNSRSILKILVFLGLFALMIGISSADSYRISVIPGNQSCYVGDTLEYQVILDDATLGLAGYEITVSLTNPSVAAITGVTFPAWAQMYLNTSVPAQSVTLTATNSAGSDDETKTAYITVTTGVIPLPGCTDPPTDPDGDGLYEDLNGNGRNDFNDIQLYYGNNLWIAANEPIVFFDFNGNGRIDFSDLQLLYADI